MAGARYVNQADWVRHTLEVQTKISRIWSLLQDAEIGQRSFILTGEDRFLQPFLDATQKLPTEVEQLTGLVQDNPEQVAVVAQIKPLIAQRIAFASETIALLRQGGFEPARQKVVEGRGLGLMQDLRQRFDRLQDAEARLLRMREAAARTTSVALVSTIVSMLLAIFGALGAWILDVRRISRELAATNAALTEQIAEREAAEIQVRQMQKMEAIGQLTGGIAHDFNNMLAIVTSGINLAQRRLAAQQDGADKFLSGALEGAQRAATLVKRLLAFSRQQPLAPVSIDANKFMPGVAELISRALGESIKMETILGGGLWLTHADPAQLENSILNLCVNSRDAMPDGGRLTVETANCHPR